MQEFLLNLLYAVITAAVPIITAFGVQMLRKAAENAAANTDNAAISKYLTEIAEAISDAVEATSQTYVDALKEAGKFDEAAQHEAARRALAACLASISPAAKAFIEELYGDITEYLTNKIEAEVRRQKLDNPATLALPVLDSTPDTTTIAASTAAATAATVVQTAINQLDTQPKTE